MYTVVRPFIDRFGYSGILELFLFVYLGSFLAISLIFYFLYFRPIMDPAAPGNPIKEAHRYALRFSLVVLFIYLVWSDRLWLLLGELQALLNGFLG